MNRPWQLQEAKNRFSEVVEEALKHGPQTITKRGVETVIVISCADYGKMKQSRKKLSQFFRGSPLAGLDLNRDKSPARDEARL